MTSAKEQICTDVILCIFVLSLCRKFDKTSAELHPIPVKGEVWHTIGVDLIGPLPETPQKDKYIMTVSYLFLSGLKQQPSPIRLPSELLSFCSTVLPDTDQDNRSRTGIC